VFVIVGLDSMVLVYAGIVPAKTAKAAKHSKERAELSVRAKLLLHRLSREKATVVLPTIALSELLVPVPSKDKGLLIARLMDSSFALDSTFPRPRLPRNCGPNIEGCRLTCGTTTGMC
jgi:hypothetical protein